MAEGILTICEVCGEERICTEKKGICTCSSACRRIAFGTDAKVPLDVMFHMTQAEYMGAVSTDAY